MAESGQRGIGRAATDRARSIGRAWAQRHPERARAEAALKQARRKALREFGHKVHGTIETHAHAARTHQGALARLYLSGAIGADQLAWAGEVVQAHAQVSAGVRVRTVSLETRVDGGGGLGGEMLESLAQARREIAYTRWRAAVRDALGSGGLALVLAMVVDDCGLALAARRGRIGKPRARMMLCAAIDRWPEHWSEACRRLDADDLLAVHAALN